MSIERKIIVTDSGGLVGRNLVHRVTARTRIVAIDKHPSNTATLARVSPRVEVIEADLARPGSWETRFIGEKGRETQVVESGLSACVLRPPPMLGSFDRKHLGWLELLSAKEWIEASCGVRIYLGFGSCCLTSNL